MGVSDGTEDGVNEGEEEEEVRSICPSVRRNSVEKAVKRIIITQSERRTNNDCQNFTSPCGGWSCVEGNKLVVKETSITLLAGMIEMNDFFFLQESNKL